MNPEPETGDLISELRIALAEADAARPEEAVGERVYSSAVSRRTPGRTVVPAAHISGAEVFERIVERTENLLGDLSDEEWHATTTVRDLTVQELVGHLIGVERGFARATRGDLAVAEDDHVEATIPSVAGQKGRDTRDTLVEWRVAVASTMASVALSSPEEVVRFHGVALPLDLYLVVRAFEMWTHGEDIERGAGRANTDPDPESLDRMTDLAAMLLPPALSAGGPGRGVSVRLVLTGAGGGTWDVSLETAAVTRAGTERRASSETLVVVDSAMFCRVVADRGDLASSGAVTQGDTNAVAELFAAVTLLALD